jgi:hypothetical protein
MLQRQQTLWLLLALVCAILSYRFPFATGHAYEKEILADFTLNAGNNFIILFATGVLILFAGITIFMYKDRKLQMKLCIIAMLLTLGTLTLYIIKTLSLVKPTVSLTSILVLGILIGFFFAYQRIRYDEKLVRSLDKLR